MAKVVESRWPGPLSGLAVAPHGSGGALDRVGTMTAAHPVPDESSVVAAQRLLDLARGAGRDDLVLVLLSGGASSLACLPAAGLGLAEKRELTRSLLRSGASIGEINAVRRHLSGFKGGRLALASAPARLVTLAISDVVGDVPEDIGSGPTAADPSTVAQAKAILGRYGIDAPKHGWSETPKRVPGAWRLAAGASTALETAAAEARTLGYAVRLLLECEGEAREVGRAHAALALQAGPGAAFISGGELTVTVRGAGRGGPNQEYALAAALALTGRSGICGLAADTDGIDGDSEAAGAFFGCGAPGGEAALDSNDSRGWFAEHGGLFVTGPTGTNVNDLRIILT